MGITDEIDELEQSLRGVDQLLTSSNKEALMLKSQLKGVNAFVSGKNYEIISRFLSGTGAWKVLNKAKATVLTMIQLVSIQERAAMQDNLRMKEMATLLKKRREIVELESQLKKAQITQDKDLIKQLKEKSDVFEGLAYQLGDEEAMKKLMKMIQRQKGIATSILGIGGTAEKQRMSTVLQQNKGILESNVLQSTLLAMGFALNATNLRKLIKNDDFMLKELQRQTDAYDEMEKRGIAEFEAIALGLGGVKVHDGKTYEDSESGLRDFLTDKFQREARHFEYGERPSKESVEKIYDKLADELGKNSFSLSKVFDTVSGKLKESFDFDLKNETRLSKFGDLINETNINDQFIKAQNEFADLTKKHDAILKDKMENVNIEKLGELASLEHEVFADLMLAKATLEGLEKKYPREEKEKESRMGRLRKAAGMSDEGNLKQALMKPFKQFGEQMEAIIKLPIFKMIKAVQDAGGIQEFFFNKLTDIGEKTIKMVRGIFKLFMKAFFWGTILLGVIFLLYNIFKQEKFGEKLEEIKTSAENFFYQYMLPALEFIGAGFMKIYDGFISGEFHKVIEGLGQIIIGLIGISFLMLGKALHILGQIVVATFELYFAWAQKTWQESKSKVIASVLYIAAGIAFIIAFFVGFPAIVVGAILLGIGYLIDKFSPFASGGVTGQGMQVVGEKGPELVKLPRGSRVYSNKQSNQMLSSGGTTNNITIQVTGRVGASDSEIKDIANKLSREMNNRMNRTGSAVSGF